MDDHLRPLDITVTLIHYEIVKAARGRTVAQALCAEAARARQDASTERSLSSSQRDARDASRPRARTAAH